MRKRTKLLGLVTLSVPIIQGFDIFGVRVDDIPQEHRNDQSYIMPELISREEKTEWLSEGIENIKHMQENTTTAAGKDILDMALRVLENALTTYK